MPVDLGNWVNIGLLGTYGRCEHTQIPDSDLTLIISWCKQESSLLMTVPTDYIDVAITGDPWNLGFALRGTNIPQLDCLIGWARCKNMVLWRWPLQVFNRSFMALKAYSELFDKSWTSLICTLVQVKWTVVGACSQSAQSVAWPIESVPFLLVFERGDFASTVLFLLHLLFGSWHGFVQFFDSLSHIEDGNFSLISPTCYNWGTMHSSDSVDAASVLNGFVSDHGFAISLFFLLTVGQFLIFVRSLLHISPLHDIKPIVGSFLGLRASYHVDIHGEDVFFVADGVVFGRIGHCVSSIWVKLPVSLRWEPSVSLGKAINWAPLSYQVINR